jgi:hypothetical protein
VPGARGAHRAARVGAPGRDHLAILDRSTIALRTPSLRSRRQPLITSCRSIYGQELIPIAADRTFDLLRSGHSCDAHHVVGHVTDTWKVAYLPNHHQRRLMQIFVALAQLFESETVRPLDGAHADVGEANLA